MAPSRRTHARARASALGALATVVMFLPAVGVGTAADRRFDGLVEEYVARRLARPPGVAAPGEPAPVSEASVLGEIAWTRALAARLAAIPAGRAAGRDIDRDLLAARIGRDLLVLEVIRPWARDPTFYRPLLDHPVRRALTDSTGTPCGRLRRATAHLAAVPEGVRAAQVLLRAPPRDLIEAALPGWQSVLRHWRTGVEAPVASCRDPEHQADLAEADSSAVHALVRFLAGLEALRDAPDVGVALGAEAMERALTCEAESADVDSVVARAIAELERDRPRIEAMAARVPGGAAALEAPSPAGNGPPRVTGPVTPLLLFLRDHGLLSVTAHDALAPPGRDPESETHESTPLERQLEGRARGLNTGPLQRLPDAPADAAGRALYWEQMMVERGLGSGDPRVELEQLTRSAQALGRLVVALSIHARGMSLRDGERFLLERCFVPPHQVAREVLGVAVDPTSAFGALVRWRLLDLRAEVERRAHGAIPLQRFHDLLLRQGAVPASIARLGLLHELESAASLQAPAAPVSGGAGRRREAKVNRP